MKVLFVIESLTCGGKERRLTELMKSLNDERGVEFELVVMNSDIHYKEVLDMNIGIHYLVRKTKKDISVFGKLYKICKKYKPDIVHCWDSMTAVYCFPVCEVLNIKLINSMVTDTQVKQNIFNKVWLRGKITFPFSNLIIGNSLAGLRSYKAPKKKSICIYNGFNFDRIGTDSNLPELKKRINPESKNIIGMVAAFEPRKDFATFISAAKMILEKRDDCIFLLIGDGEMKNTMEKMVKDEYKRSIIFLGKLDNVEEYVKIFDIGVLCTNTNLHLEGVSNSILEYMALGKPVIATSGGGTDEIVENNKTGLLITNANTNELADKILILLNDIEMRTKMGLSAKKRIQDHFSISMMIKGYISAYQKVTAKN